MAFSSMYEYGSKSQGWTFLVFGSISFVIFIYAAIISKILPPYDNPFLAAIQNDSYWEAIGRPFPVQGKPKSIPSNMEGCFSSKIMNFIAYQYEFMHHIAGDLFNSCRLIEGTYVGLLNKLEMNANMKQWAIGPVLPDLTSKDSIASRHKSLEWLDKQAPKSVIYVSFGSSTTITDEQIQELAMRLEHSKQKFLWVLRDTDKGIVFDGETRKVTRLLPRGYEERTDGTTYEGGVSQLELNPFIAHLGG